MPSGLAFETPDTFSNDRIHETTRSSVQIQGELASRFVPTLDCSGGGGAPIGTGIRIRWENTATGDSGETSASVGCVDSGTIFGVGVRTYWVIDRVQLELGMNEIAFRTYRDGTLVGRDRIRIRRTDGVPPEVTYHYPMRDEQNVPLGRPVVVRFSEPMREDTLTGDRLALLDDAGRGVSGVHHYDAAQHVWTFRPDANLIAGAAYQVVVSGEVADVGGGGPLGEALRWFFRAGDVLDAEAPQVVARWPDANGCDCAATSTRIFVGFDEPLEAGSVSEETVHLESEAAGLVPATVVYHGAHVELLPETPLAPDTGYSVRLTSGLTDTLGQPLVVSESWSFRTGSDARFGQWQEMAEPPLALQSAAGAWTGTDYIVWGTARRPADACDGDPACNPSSQVVGQALVYQPGSGWRVANHERDRAGIQGVEDLQPFPAVRQTPTVAWTGRELIVYGGERDGRPVAEGGLYDPVSDSWRQMSSGWWLEDGSARISLQGQVDHSAVWTGKEMITWGGTHGRAVENPTNRGWRYDPDRDAWRLTGTGPDVDENWQLLPDTDPLTPEGRTDHAAVWTGSEMIVWGGLSAEGTPLADAGRYDPENNAWTAAGAENVAPGSAVSAAAVWTGREMIAWNGGSRLRASTAMRAADLGRYDPLTDTWLSSAAGWEPNFLSQVGNLISGTHPGLVRDGAGRFEAVWTGSEMLVVGVTDVTSVYDEEAYGFVTEYVLIVWAYDPAADAWRQGAEVRAAPGLQASFDVAWTGSEVLVFLGDRLLRFSP